MHSPAVVILPIFDYEDEKAIEETVKAMLWAYDERAMLPKVLFKCPKCDKYTLLDLPSIIHTKYDWFCIEGRYADCIPEHSRNFSNALGIEQLQKIHPNNLYYMLQNIIYPDGLWCSMTGYDTQLPDTDSLSLTYADNLYVVIDYHY
jgi:hypothetical protein